MIRLHHAPVRGHYAQVRFSGRLRHVTAYYPTAAEAEAAGREWARGVGGLKLGPQGRPKREGESDGANEG